MTDDRRTVADLERDRVWTRTNDNGGTDLVAHLSADCHALRRTASTTTHPTASLDPSMPVCRFCDGTVTQPSTQSTAPYRTLRDADPEDLLG